MNRPFVAVQPWLNAARPKVLVKLFESDRSSRFKVFEACFDRDYDILMW